MHLGLHVGVSDGYPAAVDYVRSVGATAMQIFSGNPRSYRVGPIDVAALERFRAAREAAGVVRSVIHTSYLINLASDDPKISKGSLGLIRGDLAIAAAGGIDIVNTHLGSYAKRDRAEGFAAVVALLGAALEGIAPGVILALENSAGAGALCGGTLEELGEIVRAVDHPQLAVCLDTAHSWAAGYALDTPNGVDAFLDLAERTIGLERVALFHFNDTQVPLGAHKDRHWHIGDGLIGFEGFRSLLAHPVLRDRTAILETPGEEADDMRNMETVTALLRGAEAAV